MTGTIKYVGIFAAFSWLLLLSGCASVQRDWRTATQLNTREAYEHFLSSRPQSEFDSEARSRIEHIRFDEALAKDEVILYDQFIRDYPRSQFLQQISSRLDKKIQYLKAHPPRSVAVGISPLACYSPVFYGHVKMAILRLMEVPKEMGFEVMMVEPGEPTDTPLSDSCDARVEIVTADRGIPAGSAVSYTFVPDWKPDNYGTLRGTAVGPHAYAYWVRVRIVHSGLGPVTEREVWSDLVGQFLGSGPDPESDEAESQRLDSLLRNIEKELRLCFKQYFVKD